MNEWFIPTDLAPVVGGVYRAFPPAGLPGFTGPFDVDILEAVEHERMRMRWRGDQLHSEVVWELCDSDPGVSLAVIQSGFLGLSGDQRRTDLAATYGDLFREKLPEVLASIAEPLTTKPPKPKRPKRPKAPKVSKAVGQPWWRRLAHIPTSRRSGMLSIVGAMVLTGLVCSALAVTMLRSPSDPAGITAGASYGPFAQSGAQPPGAQPGGAQPTVTVTPTNSGPNPNPNPNPNPVRSRTVETGVPAASAEYRTSERLQLGYIGAITIKAGATPINGWWAVVDLPNRATVTSAWEEVEFTQEHKKVTFTPASTKRDIAVGAVFTFYFQVGDPTDSGKPLWCAVNDVPCDGLGE